jgi:hypothetical protein
LSRANNEQLWRLTSYAPQLRNAFLRPVQRFLQALDRTLEKLATDLYGPPQGRTRPSLWTKLAVFARFATLLALGFAARW